MLAKTRRSGKWPLVAATHDHPDAAQSERSSNRQCGTLFAVEDQYCWLQSERPVLILGYVMVSKDR